MRRKWPQRFDREIAVTGTCSVRYTDFAAFCTESAQETYQLNTLTTRSQAWTVVAAGGGSLLAALPMGKSVRKRLMPQDISSRARPRGRWHRGCPRFHSAMNPLLTKRGYISRPAHGAMDYKPFLGLRSECMTLPHARTCSRSASCAGRRNGFALHGTNIVHGKNV
jgi:hypothetical protein